MGAQDLIDQDRLTEAVLAQSAEIKAHPEDRDGRFTLAALLAFSGQFERAAGQLDALAKQDPTLLPGVVMYRALVASELAREAFWRGGPSPMLPPLLAGSAQPRLDALRALVAGDAAQAATVLDQAAPDSSMTCRIDGREVVGLKDGDDRLGPVLEVFAGGRYLWIPFEYLRAVRISEPRRLLDLLWVHATLEDVAGNHSDVHLPALYEGTSRHPDDRVRLGRMTCWEDVSGIAFRGLGRRMLNASAVDSNEPLELDVLGIRSIERTHVESDAHLSGS
jgi:type VI secretion system protein ImpE